MGGGDLPPPDDALTGSIVIGGVLADDGRLGVAVTARAPCFPHASRSARTAASSSGASLILRSMVDHAFHASAAVVYAPADDLRLMRRWGDRVLGHSFADQVGVLPPTVALARSWVLTASTHLRLGSAGIVWYLLPARIARQGGGDVTVYMNRPRRRFAWRSCPAPQRSAAVIRQT
jgi:hypothetical protein